MSIYGSAIEEVSMMPRADDAPMLAVNPESDSDQKEKEEIKNIEKNLLSQLSSVSPEASDTLRTRIQEAAASGNKGELEAITKEVEQEKDKEAEKFNGQLMSGFGAIVGLGVAQEVFSHGPYPFKGGQNVPESGYFTAAVSHGIPHSIPFPTPQLGMGGGRSLAMTA